MRTLPTVLISAAALLTACGPSLRYERDATFPIPMNATWAWGAPDGDSPAPTGARMTAEDTIQGIIADAIEAELTSRGFWRAPSSEAAFVVHFHTGRQTVVDTIPVRDDPVPPGGASTPSGSWGGYGRPEALGNRVVVWEEGMLIVDVLPRNSPTVAWRGIILDEIAPAAERDPAKAIREAVRKLMQGFP